MVVRVGAQLWRLAEAAVVGKEGHLICVAHRVNTAGVVTGSIRRPYGACRANVEGHVFVNPTCTGSLVARPYVSSVACASARPSGTTNSAIVDAVESTVTPIFDRLRRSRASANCLTARPSVLSDNGGWEKIEFRASKVLGCDQYQKE